MTIAQALMPEYEHEMAGVRRVLERIPDEKFGWKAHDKSNTIGWLASHLANIPHWATLTFEGDEWDLHPPGGEMYQAPVFDNTAAVLESFDENVAASKARILSADDAQFAKEWKLLKQGETVMAMPKAAVIRTWVLNHSIHHRGIMTVYLRLNDLPVPGLYGPSGDEPM